MAKSNVSYRLLFLLLIHNRKTWKKFITLNIIRNQILIIIMYYTWTKRCISHVTKINLLLYTPKKSENAINCKCLMPHTRMNTGFSEMRNEASLLLSLYIPLVKLKHIYLITCLKYITLIHILCFKKREVGVFPPC